MPVYEAEKFLSKAVESILCQDVVPIELILIDDGSKDSSGSICDAYGKKDSRVRVVHQENQGISFARNTGLEKAAGKFIMFCDDDDIYSAEFISMAVRMISETKADVVRFQCKVNDEPSYGTRLSEPYCIEQGRKDTKYETYLLNCGPLFVWNAIYSGKLIRENKIAFNPACKYGLEDFFFNAEVHAAADRCVVCPQLAYEHTEHTNHSMSKKRNADILKYKFAQEPDLLKLEIKAVQHWQEAPGQTAICNERLAEVLARFRHQMKEAGFSKKERARELERFRQEVIKLGIPMKEWHKVSPAPVKARILLFSFRYRIYSLFFI